MKFSTGWCIIIKRYLGVAQLVARYLGVVEVACSNQVTQTSKARHKTGFIFLINIMFCGEYLTAGNPAFLPVCPFCFQVMNTALQDKFFKNSLDTGRIMCYYFLAISYALVAQVDRATAF